VVSECRDLSFFQYWSELCWSNVGSSTSGSETGRIEESKRLPMYSSPVSESYIANRIAAVQIMVSTSLCHLVSGRRAGSSTHPELVGLYENSQSRVETAVRGTGLV
jgi:hypothetical protein